MDAAFDPGRRALFAALAGSALAVPSAATGKKGRKAKPPLAAAVARTQFFPVDPGAPGDRIVVSVEIVALRRDPPEKASLALDIQVAVGTAEEMRAAFVRAVQDGAASQLPGVPANRVAVLVL